MFGWRKAARAGLLTLPSDAALRLVPVVTEEAAEGAATPPAVSGSATVFNPVTDPEAFPGDFSDRDGNLLLSGVFAAVELLDGSGDPLRQLDKPATLRMRMPRDSWSIVQDITPGNGQIDVPLYSFAEVLGTWIREGQAVLEDGNGRTLAEGEIGDIRSGAYAGVVVARGEVQHFSYWNVDWPVTTHACITGIIIDADGKAVRGATVTTRGVTYTGTGATTHSLVLRGKTGTIRRITSTHQWDKLMRFSSIKY